MAQRPQGVSVGFFFSCGKHYILSLLRLLYLLFFCSNHLNYLGLIQTLNKFLNFRQIHVQIMWLYINIIFSGKQGPWLQNLLKLLA